MKLKRHTNFLSENNNQQSVKVGDRVEMIKMADNSPIEKGEQGEVILIDGIGQIHVDWDNGRTLAIIPEEDQFKIIS